jgi:hypothetical protein
MHVVGVTCSGCGIKLFVMFRDVFESDEAQAIRRAVRFEIEVAGVETDALFAVADGTRHFICPECAARGWLPPAEELFL